MQYVRILVENTEKYNLIDEQNVNEPFWHYNLYVCIALQRYIPMLAC